MRHCLQTLSYLFSPFLTPFSSLSVPCAVIHRGKLCRLLRWRSLNFHSYPFAWFRSPMGIACIRWSTVYIIQSFGKLWKSTARLTHLYPKPTISRSLANWIQPILFVCWLWFHEYRRDTSLSMMLAEFDRNLHNHHSRIVVGIILS